MTEQGFISLYRSLMDWEWYTDPNTMRLFIHCLLRANWRTGKWKGQTVDRGEFISSPSTLAKELGLSRQQIRTALAKLASTNDVTTSGCSQHTVFTVVSYDKYQIATKQVTNEQPTYQPTEQPSFNQAQNANSNQAVISETPCYSGDSEEVTQTSNQALTSVKVSAPTNDPTNLVTTNNNNLTNYQSNTREQVLISAWQPNAESLQMLRQINRIPQQFIEEQLTDFISYRLGTQDRLTHASWNSRFAQQCLGNWRTKRQVWEQSNATNQSCVTASHKRSASSVEQEFSKTAAYHASLEAECRASEGYGDPMGQVVNGNG